MKRGISGIIAAVLVGATAMGLAAPAFAQQPPAPLMAKAFESIDHNGVVWGDAASGFTIRLKEPAVGIGDPNGGGLYWQRWHEGRGGNAPGLANYDVTQTFNSNLDGQYMNCTSGFSITIAASVGDNTETFSPGALPYKSVQMTGARIGTDGKYYRSDGAVIEYVYAPPGIYGDCPKTAATRIKSMTKPDGEVITWHYYTFPSGPYAGISRLQSVTNNLNYQIHFQYERDTATNLDELVRWRRVQKVTAIDNALNPCAPTAFSCNDSTGADWPYLIYGYENAGTVLTVTDRLGNVSRFTYSASIETTTFLGVSLTGYRGPAGASQDVSISYSPFAIVNANGTWVYGASGGVTLSGPNGYSRSATFSQPDPVLLLGSLPLTDTVNGRTTTFTWEDGGGPGPIAGARLLRVTGHDGDYIAYDYDARRNITHERRVAKPGSGLGDIHLYASYPESSPTAIICANAKTCNKPLSITNARGYVTDFTYDAGHGGLLTSTLPAPGSGPYASIRPQTRYTYSTNGTSIWRLASTSSCKTTSSCANGADETVVATTYNTKRLPSSVTTRSGNSSITSTTATTYTPQGDVATVDGPLTGTADTTRMYYDSARRLRATVEPDPDGGGALLYRVTRTTYNGDGNPVLIDRGGTSTPSSWDSLAIHARAYFEYDSFGRKTLESQVNLGTGQSETLSQFSYDTAGRVECVARRMNPAVYGSLPGACTQSTVGSFGEDRIVRTTYTANGDPLVVQSGYGTSLVRNERTFTYLAPGQIGTLKDAANNLTTYEFDGFNRLSKTRYPITSVGAGASSTTDYEQLTFDAASNVVTERRRDGLTITNTWDNLNRLRFVDRPGGELDVTNSYDNFAQLIAASQTGASVSWTYDALGRVLTEVQPNGTVSYAYNAAGLRTQLTYPGSGFYINYQYYDDGRTKLIGLNGATTGSNVLVTYYDDQLGRRVSMCRGTGTTSSCSSVARTTYGYDAISRLSGLTHDLITGGSANDASWTLSYSPASQLITRSATSALYEWSYSPTFTDAYAVNGLNQYTTVAGAGLAYDGRGNTTNDTTKTYAYDSSNRLVTASNGASLAYDPTGRLFSVTQGGTTTKFLYDGTRLIAEYNGSNTLLRRYVHGDGVDDPVVWYDSSGTTNKRNLFKDERGSVIAADTGSAVTARQYDEYGNGAGSYTGRFQYTGQTWLSEISLNYYKARVYNPDIGRFMQTDPIGTKDQVNLYAYVGNDPTNRADSAGLCQKSTSLWSYGSIFCDGVEWGKPQVTRGSDGATHAADSVVLGRSMAAGGEGAKTHYNQKLSTITGDPTAPGIQPDAAVVAPAGKNAAGKNHYTVDPGEVTSRSQTPEEMRAKYSDIVGRTYTNRAGETFTIRAPQVTVLSRGLVILDVVNFGLGVFANPQDPLAGVSNGVGLLTPSQWEAYKAWKQEIGCMDENGFETCA